jgi:hypothetical protein
MALQDGSVDEAVFEEARQKVDECFVDFLYDHRVEERQGACGEPLREGKSVHSMESCV